MSTFYNDLVTILGPNLGLKSYVYAYFLAKTMTRVDHSLFA